MVFQFEHVGLDQGADEVGRRARCGCPTSRRRSGAGRPGLAEVGWNSLYWNNHDQPRIVSRFGDDGEHRVRVGEDARHGPAPAPRHAVRLPGRGARHDERAVRPASTTSATSSRSTTTPTAVAHGDDPADVLAALRHDGPRQRAHADAVGRLAARRLHHRHAVDRGQPELHRDQRRGRASPTRTPCFHHYRRLIELRHSRAGRRPRRLHDAAARRRARLRVHPPARRRRAAGAGQLLRRDRRRRARRAGTPPSSCSATTRSRPRGSAAPVGGAGPPAAGGALASDAYVGRGALARGLRQTRRT